MKYFAVFALTCALATANPLEPSRIVGGSVTTIEQYPEMVALLYSGFTINTFRQHCGGVILNNKAVLTAAHCTMRVIPRVYRIRIGSTLRHQGGRVFDLLSIINHPNFNRANLDSDISVLIAIGILPNTATMRPARIAGTNYVVADNEPVWAAGWGMTIEGNINSGSETLRHVQMWSVNQHICRQRYAGRHVDGLLQPAEITDNMMCVGWLDVGGRDQCTGDSGGPLFHHGVVVGICSWGEGCGRPEFPGVNTRVSRFTNWIAQYAR